MKTLILTNIRSSQYSIIIKIGRMKNIVLVFPIAAIITILSCNSKDSNSNTLKKDSTSNTQKKELLTTVQWLDSLQTFDKVIEGEKVIIMFNFKNTGNNPLIIKDVTASCGCTVPEKPKEPIPPGETGVIKAEFNSENRVGFASKDVIVTCNTASETYTLHFEGEVLKKK